MEKHRSYENRGAEWRNSFGSCGGDSYHFCRGKLDPPSLEQAYSKALGHPIGRLTPAESQLVRFMDTCGDAYTKMVKIAEHAQRELLKLFKEGEEVTYFISLKFEIPRAFRGKRQKRKK